ncbi:MAG: succinate dehydrogenase, cytochrome b556 subunit [Pseudomonadota bacterium]
MTQKTSENNSRPLSPHVFLYKWHITMAISILHRITGCALVVGSFFLLAWLWAAAYSPACFSLIHDSFNTIIGRLVLVSWSLAFYFHFCNGIRHLFWDIGKGFEIKKADRSGYAVILFSAVLTLITWYAILVL